MPSVISEVIIPLQTSVGPGGRFQSQEFDVSGTQSISVNVSITNVNPTIKRTIFFGPSPNGGFQPARVDAFQTSNHLLTSLPTHGPKMFVVVENTGLTAMNCDGWLYGVRLVP
ncbi:hypothetical protein [Corallococcus sicarius]|nr:hypothetical protein [Corallococcus sicarius]